MASSGGWTKKCVSRAGMLEAASSGSGTDENDVERSAGDPADPSQNILKRSNIPNIMLKEDGKDARRLEDIDNGNQLWASSADANFKGKPPPVKMSEFREMHDLTKLDCITVDNVLQCLRERYRSQMYYTYAGPVLLSLNSCQKVPRASLVEDLGRMSWYFVDVGDVGNPQKENDNGNESKESGKRSPHVYEIGRQCLRNLVTVGSHHIILVSGESGAGKTTATQQLIKYLTENNSRNFGANTCSNLDKKIYFATLILESFGNAQTQSNPNSSRFGRLVQLNYSKGTGRITGAEIQTYLLEKHRVAKYNFQTERTFHIFYYILHGLRKGILSLSVPNDDGWKVAKGLVPEHLLAQSVEGGDDEVYRLLNAVQAFSMTEDFTEIVSILFAMMTLLKIHFIPDCDSSSEEEYESGLESPYKTEFTVSEWTCAKLAAGLLGVKDSELVDILIARKITAGSSHRHSIFRKPCELASECEERLHALTSFIYSSLFSYVLNQLNSTLKMEKITFEGAHESENMSTLSLLDLYGFENFTVNHLEQVCINYANERLQQVNISIVKSYYEQSVAFDEIQVPPVELNRIENELNQRIQDLHTHVFSFLDEECLLKRLSDDKDLLERMRIATSNSRFIRTSRPHESRNEFTVTHYATKVTYQLKGLVQKNKDHIPPEFQDILKSSTNSFIATLFKYDLIRSRNASGTPRSNHTVSNKNNKNTRGKTILTGFKASVEDLMARLKANENNDIHFIRCIRPNADLAPGTFSMDIVEKQLYACGIADVVKIAGNGYPIRLEVNVSKFCKEFSRVISYFCSGNLDPKLISLAFSGTNKTTAPMKFGKSIVFMSEKCWKQLKKTEQCLGMLNSRVIQRAWRAYIQRKEVLKRAHVQSLASKSNSALETSGNLSSMGPYGDSGMDSFGDNFSNIPISWESIDTFSPSRGPRTSSRQVHLPLYYGSGIASRAPVHTLPIKMYTKKTCLPFGNKAPRRLVSNGISDAFEDHGINFLTSMGPSI